MKFRLPVNRAALRLTIPLLVSGVVVISALATSFLVHPIKTTHSGALHVTVMPKPTLTSSPRPSASPAASGKVVFSPAPRKRLSATPIPAKRPLPVITPGSTPEPLVTPSPTPIPSPSVSPIPYEPAENDICPKDTSAGIYCWHVVVAPSTTQTGMYDYSCFYAFTDGTWAELPVKTSAAPDEALTCQS